MYEQIVTGVHGTNNEKLARKIVDPEYKSMEKRYRIKINRCITTIIARRNWILLLSIVLNLCVVLYICAHLTSSCTWFEVSSPNWSAYHYFRQGQNKNAIPRTVEETIRCHEKSMEPRLAQRGDYWVWYNYVPMNTTVKCWESVTYTTHADYTFMDNLEPMLERWRAPVSIAMYAPGEDFQPTVDSIKYVRSCGSSLITQFVTFHVYFNSGHMPEKVLKSNDVVSASYDCSMGPPWKRFSNISEMYKNVKNLTYPVNVGRNIARESAPTQYVLASDIELYPNPNVSTAFLDMIARQDHPAVRKVNPKVFVLPVFEISAESQPPLNKTSLMQMLKAGTARPFHSTICRECHTLPGSTEWQEAPETASLNISNVGKRTGIFRYWEPFYIGTNSDPPYDERLSWEGMRDKIVQGYALCALDYDFLILNNAFLVHRPGFKTSEQNAKRKSFVAETNSLISKIILPELKILYGSREDCST